MSSRFIHVVTCVRISCLYKAEYIASFFKRTRRGGGRGKERNRQEGQRAAPRRLLHWSQQEMMMVCPRAVMGRTVDRFKTYYGLVKYTKFMLFSSSRDMGSGAKVRRIH